MNDKDLLDFATRWMSKHYFSPRPEDVADLLQIVRADWEAAHKEAESAELRQLRHLLTKTRLQNNDLQIKLRAVEAYLLAIQKVTEKD